MVRVMWTGSQILSVRQMVVQVLLEQQAVQAATAALVNVPMTMLRI